MHWNSSALLIIEVQTHNTDLKKRLTAFAGQSTRNAAARPTQTNRAG